MSMRERRHSSEAAPKEKRHGKGAARGRGCDAVQSIRNDQVHTYVSKEMVSGAVTTPTATDGWVGSWCVTCVCHTCVLGWGGGGVGGSPLGKGHELKELEALDEARRGVAVDKHGGKKRR